MTTQLQLRRKLLFALTFLLTFVTVTAQVSTRVNSNGSTSLRIQEAKGLRYWSAFDHNNSGRKIDGDTPPECPTDYSKDPTAKLKGGMKYWLRYRDCEGGGNVREFEAFFDKSKLDEWVEAPAATIPPPPDNKGWIYYGIPALFILLVVFLFIRRKRTPPGR